MSSKRDSVFESTTLGILVSRPLQEMRMPSVLLIFSTILARWCSTALISF